MSCDLLPPRQSLFGQRCALHALHQATRAPAWSLATSRPSGTRCQPVASHWPSGPGMALGALALALTGLHAARAPHKQVGKWRAPAASVLCPLCLLVWSGVRQSKHPRTAAAAAPALLHAQAHPHSHSLLLSHSVGRSGLSFFLCLSPPLFTLFLPPPNLPSRPRQSVPSPRETALSLSPSESA